MESNWLLQICVLSRDLAWQFGVDYGKIRKYCNPFVVSYSMIVALFINERPISWMRVALG